MGFFSSAPCKAILFGEHYVVYGSQALSIPIEPRNRVEFSECMMGGGIALFSDKGQGLISGNGGYSGEQELACYSAVANEIFKGEKIPSCTVKFLPAWNLKGVGTSSSFGAAFAAGLLNAVGKKAGARRIFLAAQAGDIVAHQGKASGIDAKTVAMGKPLLFQRRFAPPSYLVRSAKFKLPPESALLLIDTFAGKRDSTAAMLAAFARSFGIATLPQLLPEEKRKAVRAEFTPILAAALKEKTTEGLGKLMNDNHILLRMRGVSSPGIEKAVSCAIKHGAYGAKITGGGGEGGAVLALCGSGKLGGISERVAAETGFKCHSVSLATKGACVDQ